MAPARYVTGKRAVHGPETSTRYCLRAPQESVCPSLFDAHQHHPGVVLSVLAARGEATYTQFGATAWLLTSATFLIFVSLWHEYLMQALAFVWIPNLLDSLVPFAFLAGELFAAHFVYHGLPCTMVCTAGSLRSVSHLLWAERHSC